MLDVTSMSSRGQVVIPNGIRKSLGLQEGEKFMVVGAEDTIILKKITMPSFDELIRKSHALGKSLRKTDVTHAIRRVR